MLNPQAFARFPKDRLCACSIGPWCALDTVQADLAVLTTHLARRNPRVNGVHRRMRGQRCPFLPAGKRRGLVAGEVD